MASSEEALEIKMLVSRNKFEEAFKMLERCLKGEDKDIALPILKSRYQAWKNDKANKSADSRDLEVAISKIRHQLLTFGQSIKHVVQ